MTGHSSQAARTTAHRPGGRDTGDASKVDARSVIESLPVGIFVIRVDAGGALSWDIANPMFDRLVGKPAHVPYDQFLNSTELYGQIFRCLSERQAVRFEWIKKGELHPSYFDCSVIPHFDAEGRITSILGTVSDRTKEKRAEHHMLHQALHDNLTSLPNRAYFDEILEQAERRRGRDPEYRFAVMVLNVDRLQSVNDSLGHLTGDELLVSLARRIQGCARAKDMVARLSGDEFGFFLSGYEDEAEVAAIAARVHKVLELPFNLSTVEICASVSIGIALCEDTASAAEDAPRDADLAMNRAKTLGRGRTVFFTEELHKLTRSRLHLEVNLRQAIEERQFSLEYQPIVCLQTGRVLSVEALARWTHPTLGAISPTDFIPLAEETGMIVHLGAWAMDEACRQLRQWQDHLPGMAPEQVCVNVSSLQLMREEFVDEVVETVKRHGLPPQALKVEVTESMLMESPEAAAKLLDRMRRQGFTLAMDDFGTGHSSLSYLQKFQFDVLKIDRSFVSHMTDSGESDKIVQVIATLARTLNLEVVAEGIETREQLVRLQALGCQYGQGYYFSRPMTVAAAGDFFRTRVPLSLG